jgi:ribosomal-protein-alanine N-acetyltransferase
VPEAAQRRCGAFDLELLARLHAEGFPDDPWSAKAFGELLAMPGTAGLLRAARPEAPPPGDTPEPAGFVLWRVAGDEAEILTLAVRPAERRAGHARALMDAALAAARESGARRMLLEVAEDNLAARGLYAALGFAQVGRRRGYYRRAGGARHDALILESRLGRS